MQHFGHSPCILHIPITCWLAIVQGYNWNLNSDQQLTAETSLQICMWPSWNVTVSWLEDDNSDRPKIRVKGGKERQHRGVKPFAKTSLGSPRVRAVWDKQGDEITYGVILSYNRANNGATFCFLPAWPATHPHRQHHQHLSTATGTLFNCCSITGNYCHLKRNGWWGWGDV